MKRFIFALFLMLCPSVFGADQVLVNNYGQQITGCIQQTLQTSGHNRVQIPWVNVWVKIWAEAAADFSTGDACRFVVGASTIDVTSIGGSKVGETIFANQQRALFVTGANTWISAISKTASSKLNICKLN